MKRLSNWRMPLAEKFHQGKSSTFAWGKFDCALFACDCISAQTAVDPAVEFRGKYASETEAATLGSLTAIAERVTAQFAMPEIAPGHAGRGDLVLVNNGTPQGALAIVDFTGAWAMCPGARGLIRVRRHRWQRAWRVG